ncbi:hypothetical protein GX51_03025 [Blastomyces parvus]|uniref:Uncharacterized protein n=1 Tax=Blastomyces parvus TaxID=2060905 RepID=A0A2B7X0Z9_9EURO|nr:hypothetical protein GX51_03025 [Blastomyces parvus]
MLDDLIPKPLSSVTASPREFSVPDLPAAHASLMGYPRFPIVAYRPRLIVGLPITPTASVPRRHNVEPSRALCSMIPAADGSRGFHADLSMDHFLGSRAAVAVAPTEISTKSAIGRNSGLLGI